MIKWIKGLLGKPVDHRELIAKGAVILDVRTQLEYRQGHVKGSVNIPLQELSRKINKLRSDNKPVIACCATGHRSGIAAKMLRTHGIEAYNGGGWNRVQRLVKG